MSLERYGWNDRLQQQWDSLALAGLLPGRVLWSGAGQARLMMAGGERPATLAGRLRLDTGVSGGPVVGDWAAARSASTASVRIEAVMPRTSALSRKGAGRRTDEQVVAANLDFVILVMGLDGDFNLRRLERLLTLVEHSGARPVVLLNKTDLCGEVAARLDSARAAAPGAPVLTASGLTGEGVESLSGCIPPGTTAVMVGSSGAGKSTLLNRLLGSAVQETREVRAHDGRGRHTTTHREMFLLPGGGLLIDNPGIREVQLWADAASLEKAFDDIGRLAPQCRFRDCRHESEPGCAVLASVQRGDLPAERLASYRSLLAELHHLETKQDVSARLEQKRRWRSIHRQIKRSKRGR